MITILVIFGIIIVGLWFYMRRTKPQTAIDEEEAKRIKLQERLKSKATSREIAQRDELAAIQQQIKDVSKPVSPMANYDADAYEKTRETDDAVRMNNIKNAMGVDDTGTMQKLPEVRPRSAGTLKKLQWEQITDGNDIEVNRAYDKKTGKLSWVFDENGPRYANKDDIFKYELYDFINS